jgi:hypothetical protein
MTDTEIKVAGMKVLAERLGLVEAERFVTLILREPFDYTAWRQDLWEDLSITEIDALARSGKKETNG